MLIQTEVEQARFGAFSCGGKLCERGNPGYFLTDEAISFVDSSGEPFLLPWIKVDNYWLAGTEVLVHIAWQELYDAGYVMGRPIWIDEKPYLCRCPRLGVKGSEGEWIQALKMTGFDERLLNWKGRYFFGQERIWEDGNVVSAHCQISGMDDPEARGTFSIYGRNALIGFRPVLEPLPPMRVLRADQAGLPLKVWCENYQINGRLLSCTDYDLVLSICPMSDFPKWLNGLAMLLSDDTLVIDRRYITYVEILD